MACLFDCATSWAGDILWTAIFMGVVIIAGAVAFIFIEPKGNSKPNYGYLITSLAGGIFFIMQVISYRNKNGS